MSKLIQIENALKAIDQAGFQMLCDDYLHRRGYEAINRIGSALGKQKTAKGTPDTYISLPNGKFVLVEYTSQERNLPTKLADDLSKCLDEKKTGIPVTDIQEIILCHNGRLQTSETKALITECQNRGTDLQVVGLDRLVLDLNSKYQILALHHLGIELDTGQILPLDDFIREYEKNQLTTPLSTRFRFREEELKAAQGTLKDSDLLIIVGKPGVGKSRFAIECGRRFARKHRSYKFFCILNKSIPIYENLKTYFPPTGNYIIFVDDANRVSEIEHILRLLNNSNSRHKVKIIVTVRDYALKKIQDLAKPYAKQTELQLENFEQKQLDELLKAEFNIQNYDYLERIWRISKGNPRLGVMAAKIVKEKKTLGSIADVTALYDTYFGSIADDLADLKNKDLLKTAGIISFFRFLDRTQEDLFNEIAHRFGLSPTVLWDNILRLHEMEIVDLYEEDIARIADQVLSTYLLYKAFIQDQVLDFSVVLNDFFDNGRYALGEYRLKDAVYPVLEAFNHRFVSERLQRHIDRKWDLVKNDEGKLLKLMDVFWFLRETHTLFYLKERIDAAVSQPLNIEQLSLVPDNNETKDPYLTILRFFGQASTDNFGIALELVLTYLGKHPKLTPQVLRLLTQNFAFGRNSHLRDYSIQRVLITTLIEKSEDDIYGEFYSRILLSISTHYLKMRFRNDWTEGRSKLVSVEFLLPPTAEIFELRKELLQFLIKAYANPFLRNSVLEILSTYSHSKWDKVVVEIGQKDSELLLPFIRTSLDPSLYLHCLIAQDYFQFLEHYKIPFDKKLKSKFRNETYDVAQVLKDDDKRLELGWREYETYRLKSLRSYFASYTFNDYKVFLDQCKEMAGVHRENHQWFPLRASIIQALLILSETNIDLFRRVITHILQDGNPLGLSDIRIVNQLIASYKNNRSAYNLLKRYNYLLKDSYLFDFITIMGQKRADKYYLSEMYKLYGRADLGQLPYDFDRLEPYEALDENVIPKVVEMIYNRAHAENARANLSSLFGSFSRTSQRLGDLFRDRLDLLKAVYLGQLASGNADHESKSFIQILRIEPHFIFEYIDWMYSNHEYLSFHEDQRNYNFLWLMDDYENILSDVIEHVFTKEKDTFTFESYLGVLFIRHEGAENEVAEKRKFEVLCRYIEKFHSDRERMRFIFKAVVRVFSHKQKELLTIFLKHNKSYEDFDALPLESSSMSSSGSFVPVYEARIQLLESLISLLPKDPALLQHKLRIEEKINGRKKDIDRESRRNFIESSI
jgi:hypothetical protein